jgi:hypothetical protein
MSRENLKIAALVLGSGSLIGIGLALAPPPPERGGWEHVCAAERTETGVNLGVRGSGGIPIGNGLTLRIDDETVCDRYAWICPKGVQCDPAKKPSP